MALAVDASSPAVAQSATATTTTAAFSPPANSLLVAYVLCDANSGALTEAGTVTSTGGLSWNRAARDNGQNTGGNAGLDEVWWTQCAAAPGSVTVSVTDNQGAVDKSLFVRVYTDSNGYVPAGLGAVVAQQGSTSVAYTSTAAGSWGWMNVIGNAGLGTAGASQTVDQNTAGGAFDGGDSTLVGHQNATTPTVGSTVTMSVTAGTIYHFIAVEVLPGQGPVAGPWTDPVPGGIGPTGYLGSVASSPMFWGDPTVATGGTTFTQTMTVAVTGTPVLTRRAGKPMTVAVSAARALVRQVGAKRTVAVTAARALVRKLSVTRPVAVTAGPSVKRRIGRAFPRAVTVTPTSFRRAGKTFTVAVSTARSLVRRVGLKRTAAVTAAPVLKRALIRLFTRTVTATATATFTRVKLLALSVAAHATPALVRRVGTRRTVAVVAAPTLKRVLARTFTRTVSASPALKRRVGRLLSVAVHATATSTTRKVFLRAFTVAVGAAATLKRRVGITRPVAVHTTSTLARQAHRALAVTVHAATAGAFSRIRHLTLTVAVHAATALRRQVGKPLPRSVTATPVLRRGLFTIYRVPVSVATKFGKGVRKTFTAAVAAAATAVVQNVTTRTTLVIQVWQAATKWATRVLTGTQTRVGATAQRWTIGGPVTATIPAVSTEYVQVPVVAYSGGAAVNPTTDTVKMAFLASQSAEPGLSDWHTGSWDTTQVGGYVAQCLVGPNGVVLAAGTWWVWVQLTASPETVVRQAGWIEVV